MKSTIIYDKETGRIVHVHCANVFSRSADDVFALVDPALERAKLAALDVDSKDLQGEGYRVNPSTKRLEPAKSGSACSAGIVRLAKT